MSDDAKIAVRLRPGGRADELLGFRDGVLRATVKAPPVDGKANRALCRLLAGHIGVPPSRVSVVRGKGSRDKVVRVEGIASAVVQKALAK